MVCILFALSAGVRVDQGNGSGMWTRPGGRVANGRGAVKDCLSKSSGSGLGRKIGQAPVALAVNGEWARTGAGSRREGMLEV